MKSARIAWITANGFRETRLRELRFSPGRGAHSSGSWAGRIARSERRGRVVLCERLLVVMSEFERVAELECGHGTRRAERGGERLRVAFGATQIAQRA